MRNQADMRMGFGGRTIREDEEDPRGAQWWEEKQRMLDEGATFEDVARERRLKRLERRMAETDAARPRANSREDVVTKDAGALGINSGQVMFGLTANKPTSSYLLTRGVRFLAYYDTQTDTLYAWNGSAWKSVALS